MATGTSLTTTHSPRERLIEELRDRDYRRAFVEAHAGDSIASQLKAMRLERGMEQRDVAAKMGNAKLQPMISRYENPDYGKYSISTLFELANVFDVALIVHFGPHSELVEWDLDQSSKKLQPAPFDSDQGLWGEGQTSTAAMIFRSDEGPVERELAINDQGQGTIDLVISATEQEYLEEAVA
jgi:transcriptional regulator with XRE-family HTH domain